MLYHYYLYTILEFILLKLSYVRIAWCICIYVYHKLANKRKAAVPPENQAKRFKPDSANKEETDNNLQQQTEMLDSKKEIEYQTNIAVCEVQLGELKYVPIYLWHHHTLFT